jgi:hypothetical protein
MRESIQHYGGSSLELGATTGITVSSVAWLEGIVIRKRDGSDWTYIYANLEPLAKLKGSPELVTQLHALERKFRDSL